MNYEGLWKRYRKSMGEKYRALKRAVEGSVGAVEALDEEMKNRV